MLQKLNFVWKRKSTAQSYKETYGSICWLLIWNALKKQFSKVFLNARFPYEKLVMSLINQTSSLLKKEHALLWKFCWMGFLVTHAMQKHRFNLHTSWDWLLLSILTSAVLSSYHLLLGFIHQLSSWSLSQHCCRMIRLCCISACHIPAWSPLVTPPSSPTNS